MHQPIATGLATPAIRVSERFADVKRNLDLPVEAGILRFWAENRLKHGNDPAIARPKLQQLVDLLDRFLETDSGLVRKHLPEVHPA